tara:strand:- start:640 stop:1218 length:579 start_codon:yes stop_codon:yes gene_type:complete
MTLRTLDIDPAFRKRIEEADPKKRKLIRGGEGALNARPGDLVQFNYTKLNGDPGSYRGLAIATQRSGTGKAVRSTLKGDRVLQVVTSDSLNEEAFEFILNTLYKNRVLSRYISLQIREQPTNKIEADRYSNNLGRLDEDEEEILSKGRKEVEEMDPERQAGMMAVLNQGQFKYFRTEGIRDFISISLRVDET